MNVAADGKIGLRGLLVRQPAAEANRNGIGVFGITTHPTVKDLKLALPMAWDGIDEHATRIALTEEHSICILFIMEVVVVHRERKAHAVKKVSNVLYVTFNMQ